MLTPDGRISRYLYGCKFKERDLRLASDRSVGRKARHIGDKLLLFCFHYDPEAKGYVPFARNIMKAGGALMVACMGIVLGFLFRRERNNSLPSGVANRKMNWIREWMLGPQASTLAPNIDNLFMFITRSTRFLCVDRRC